MTARTRYTDPGAAISDMDARQARRIALRSHEAFTAAMAGAGPVMVAPAAQGSVLAPALMFPALEFRAPPEPLPAEPAPAPEAPPKPTRAERQAEFRAELLSRIHGRPIPPVGRFHIL